MLKRQQLLAFLNTYQHDTFYAQMSRARISGQAFIRKFHFRNSAVNVLKNDLKHSYLGKIRVLSK